MSIPLLKKRLRKCYICKKIFPLTDKYFNKSKSDKYGGHRYDCKKCHLEENKKWKKCGRKSYSNSRRQVFVHYSNGKPKCKKCSCKIYEVLELDHINNDGAKERKKIKSSASFYKKIIADNYPKKYQVLCKNCNWLKYLKKLKKDLPPK